MCVFVTVDAEKGAHCKQIGNSVKEEKKSVRGSEVNSSLLFCTVIYCLCWYIFVLCNPLPHYFTVIVHSSLTASHTKNVIELGL